ncbi:hypothetical protein [Streptomyces sp. NPDC006193]|uniref:hypothetical protein n=1 Tax=Streptomyces sp. NPDC006193 TaxID=3155717 RepID=UPI00339EE22B
MGEPHGGEEPPGRRRARRRGAAVAPERTPGWEARLGAALRAGGPDPEAERRAVTAFRAARETGPGGARTRARDDWRPGRP